ncbi:MAG: LLM class flavin-dependent oxidoreductase [Alphaproteobacteria bacterium]|nr:LLM class flavin-dependent oxidoreductase [Alphaproteobacteria bacterium]
MKFHLAVNMERFDPSIDMSDNANHVLKMVQMADRGGFDVAWAAEHHALEMTVAPNPFHILSWWAAHTKRIRLGSAVATAAYWHPIKLAGEAALTDLFSGGRLEFGVGSGAYQREFDRMKGIKQSEGWRYMNEMIPAVRALWHGDYEHDGEFWQFPLSTSVPKPIQQPHPPIWVAARAPISFDYAVEQSCNIMSWPLTRDMSEVKAYKQRLDDAMQKFPDKPKPHFSMMRHTAVYRDKQDWMIPVQAVQRQLGQFANVFNNLGDVKLGFPKQIPIEQLENRAEYNPRMLHDNLMFGTADEVVSKLRLYEALGVDSFIYYSSTGLNREQQQESLQLFIDEVMPKFE